MIIDSDSPGAETKTSRNSGGMKIQLGTLNHRGSWGDKDDDVDLKTLTTGTLEIGGQDERSKKNNTRTKGKVTRSSKGATRRYKVGSLRFGGKAGDGGWFGSSSSWNSCWVELDIKEKELKWYVFFFVCGCV